MTTRKAALNDSEYIADVLGAELHYWVYREEHAPATANDPEFVVMVHGLRGTHHGLEPIIEHLPGRCVVVPDLPGFGDSGPMPDEAHDVAGYAKVVSALIARMGQRPVALLGHSFGSLVAARVAATAPELVRRLVLVNPISTPALDGPGAVLSGLTSTYYSLGKALPERVGHRLLSNKLVVLAASYGMTRTKDKEVRRFVYDSHLQHFSRFHSAAVLSETYEASVSSTVADDAASLSMPTLLIAGETDEIAPLDGQQELVQRLPHGELVVIPEVGHLVHYETPAVAAAEIERFLGWP